MTIKVTQTTNSYSVKIKPSPQNFKLSVSGEVSAVAGNLSDLEDVDSTGIQNGYVLVYDASAQKYIAVDPDQVLSNAVVGGLPSDFIDKLDVDLDDKIDLDAGTF